MGVVIGSRAFFSPLPCKQAREEVLVQLGKHGINPVILPVEATANGAVQSVEDAKLYAEHFSRHRGEIDGLVISRIIREMAEGWCFLVRRPPFPDVCPAGVRSSAAAVRFDWRSTLNMS